MTAVPSNVQKEVHHACQTQRTRRDAESITYRPISQLRLDPRNPRIHSAKQVRQIARSIQNFGFNVPVLINAKGQLIAGHGRILACQQLGWTEVPTIALEHPSEAQARAFMIADNRLTEVSIWDDRLLAEQLKELSAMELEFDVEAIGFDTAEIDLRIESLSRDGDQSEDPADLIGGGEAETVAYVCESKPMTSRSSPWEHGAERTPAARWCASWPRIAPAAVPSGSTHRNRLELWASSPR